VAFFVGLSVFADNPFARIWELPNGARTVATFAPVQGAVAVTLSDGNGLNPLLRHPGMIFHPPMQYLGFVSLVIPFAFAVASLITGRTDDRWMRITRRWTLAGWLFLSIGLVLGSRWAYDVLGWGGYWGWDPVEVVALMPWISGTAFLHSVMLQEKRGLAKRWNVILIILTYLLVILGTFLTRSGLLTSVHAFSDSKIGPVFLGFVALMLLFSVSLVVKRWASLKAETQMNSLLSRESLFMLNNMLFMGILVVCFWGVFYPIISELFAGVRATVGPEYYESTAGPLFLAVVVLMGFAPLSMWGRSMVRSLGVSAWIPLGLSLLLVVVVGLTGIFQFVSLLAIWGISLAGLLTLFEYGRGVWQRHKTSGDSIPQALWRLAGLNRRRYGGMIVHLGIVLMSLGVIGIEMFQTQTQGRVEKNSSLQLSGYTLTYRGLDFQDDTISQGFNAVEAKIDVTRDGAYLGQIKPRSELYFDSMQTVTLPGMRSTLTDDLYVILVNWETVSDEFVTLKVYNNPLINWLWIGTLVFIFGTLVAAWSKRESA
jgi:cytochrome c-type biogenesis protein CcmF